MNIDINISTQSLTLLDDQGRPAAQYAISSAINGPGQLQGSRCTPLGRHVIRAKIGAGAPINTVFVGRRPTGDIYSLTLGAQFPQRDWILTRILWLSGCEVGHNRLGQVDTMRRYIYIHGSPDNMPMGVPGSIGCIRMRNIDVMTLFDQVSPGTAIKISI